MLTVPTHRFNPRAAGRLGENAFSRLGSTNAGAIAGAVGALAGRGFEGGMVPTAVRTVGFGIAGAAFGHFVSNTIGLKIPGGIAVGTFVLTWLLTGRD